MLRILRNKRLQRFVRFREFLFVPLSFSEQKISVGRGERARLTVYHLLVLLRAFSAR